MVCDTLGPGYNPKIVVYSSDHETNACSVIRILSPMIAANWDVVWAKKLDENGLTFDIAPTRSADMIVIHRFFPSRFTEKTLLKLLKLKIPIVYDLDDAILEAHESHPTFKYMNENASYTKWLLREADIVTVSTEALGITLKKYTSRPIVVRPNLVSWELFYSSRKEVVKQFTFLVSGTDTHGRDWEIIEEPLAEILCTYGDNVSAVFFGKTPDALSNHPLVKTIGFMSSYYDYAVQLKHMNVHAALVPLEETNFNRCKSNIKWLEYSVAGIAGAYSDIVPYSNTIKDNINGLLVKNNKESWYKAMKSLYLNGELRQSIIENAREEILAKYSLEKQIHDYVTVFNNLLYEGIQRSCIPPLETIPIRMHAYLHLYCDNITTYYNRNIRWRYKR